MKTLKKKLQANKQILAVAPLFDFFDPKQVADLRVDFAAFGIESAKLGKYLKEQRAQGVCSDYALSLARGIIRLLRLKLKAGDDLDRLFRFGLWALNHPWEIRWPPSKTSFLAEADEDYLAASSDEPGPAAGSDHRHRHNQRHGRHAGPHDVRSNKLAAAIRGYQQAGYPLAAARSLAEGDLEND